MLKLYTDKSFLTEKNRSIVFPLLFDLFYLNSKTLKKYYNVVQSIEKSDIIVFPIDYSKFLKSKEALNSLIKLSKEHDKPIWIYTAGDYGFTNYINNSYTFRFSGFHSKLKKNTFVLPCFTNDPFIDTLQKTFSVLEKEKTPTIGFVGHAQFGAKKYLKELVNHLKYRLKIALNLVLADKQSFYPSSVKRALYLRKLQLSKGLKTNFILRNKYRAGSKNQEDRKVSATEFYDNIYNNLYTFCSRGVGNFSVRFYETLAVGRIPVLLNTDCRLPLPGVIDWEKHIMVLDVRSKESFQIQILKFHNTKTNEELKDIQKSNRLLWETHLKRDNFFIQIYNIFKTKKL